MSTPLPADELEQAQLFKILQSPEGYSRSTLCSYCASDSRITGVAVGAGSRSFLQAAKGIGNGAYDAGWGVGWRKAHEGKWNDCNTGWDAAARNEL